MFLDLINLYNKNKNSNRTPLEDFNTESFANILNLYPVIKADFFDNFLQLPQDNYSIKTQLKKDLPGSINCIIDLVLIGRNNVCFVENKVESTEGEEQLKRYGNVLDIYYPTLQKHLFYCTKYTDIKNQNKEYSIYNFKQFKWFEIAKFLTQYKQNPLISEYLKFLTKYKMAQDNTFKVENLLTLQNMNKTIDIVNFHIENCKEQFNSLYGSYKYNSNHNWGQLKNHSRFSHYNTGILCSPSNKYSEILYAIEFDDLSLACHIYANSDHEQVKLLNKVNLDNTSFQIRIEDWGTAVYIKEDLGKFLNNEDSDELIKQWFICNFNMFKNLISNNPQISWNII